MAWRPADPPLGTILRVRWPHPERETELHYAIVIKYPDGDDPLLAVGTSKKRPKHPRTFVDWDEDRGWWVGPAKRPKGRTWFYRDSGDHVPREFWVDECGEVDIEKMLEIADTIDPMA